MKNPMFFLKICRNRKKRENFEKRKGELLQLAIFPSGSLQGHEESSEAPRDISRSLEASRGLPKPLDASRGLPRPLEASRGLWRPLAASGDVGSPKQHEGPGGICGRVLARRAWQY